MPHTTRARGRGSTRKRASTQHNRRSCAALNTMCVCSSNCGVGTCFASARQHCGRAPGDRGLGMRVQQCHRARVSSNQQRGHASGRAGNAQRADSDFSAHGQQVRQSTGATGRTTHGRTERAVERAKGDSRFAERQHDVATPLVVQRTGLARTAHITHQTSQTISQWVSR
jgi:hypothetical protein